VDLFTVHIVLIASGILFGTLFSVTMLFRYLGTGNLVYVVAGLASALATITLGVYLAYFRRKIRSQP
jgi:hypothetical protein